MTFKKLFILGLLLCVTSTVYAQQPVNATLSAETTKNIGTIRNVGNVGGVFDAVQGAAAPANAMSIGGTYNTVLPTIGNGDISQLQLDVKGQTLVDLNYYAGTALGAPSNYGTSPGTVAVFGVNAFVTNAGSIGTPTPSTSSANAFTKYHSASAAAANIKASAGNLYGLIIGNSGSIPCWLQLFNTAGTPTAGTSVVDSIMVQAGLTVVVPANTLAYENFTTGIAAAGATTDSGATTTGCTTSVSVSSYYQ